MRKVSPSMSYLPTHPRERTTSNRTDNDEHTTITWFILTARRKTKTKNRDFGLPLAFVSLMQINLSLSMVQLLKLTSVALMPNWLHKLSCSRKMMGRFWLAIVIKQLSLKLSCSDGVGWEVGIGTWPHSPAFVGWVSTSGTIICNHNQVEKKSSEVVGQQ